MILLWAYGFTVFNFVGSLYNQERRQVKDREDYYPGNFLKTHRAKAWIWHYRS